MCTARTASSSWSERVTTEIRISDVEIISMLIPASDSAANSRADTPGCDFMPAPIRDSLPMVSSYCSDVKPMSGWCSVRAVVAAAPSLAGSVNEMSVRPVAAAETFCTIMSRFTPAAATTSKMRAALPGTSGTSTIVILASLRSCATPAMIGCSIGAPSSFGASVTSVPVCVENDDRTCTGTA